MSESVTMQNNGDRELGALATLERMVCMDERLHDLARSNGDSPRETTARRWILAGCRSCGQCAEMAT